MDDVVKVVGDSGPTDTADDAGSRFVPVYRRGGVEPVVKDMGVTLLLRQADGRVVERDGVTGALIGVYELRSVG